MDPAFERFLGMQRQDAETTTTTTTADGERDMFVDDLGTRIERLDFRVAIEAGMRRVNSEKNAIKRTKAAGVALPGEPGYRAPPVGLYSSPLSSLEVYPKRVVLATTFPFRYNYSLLCSARHAIRYLCQRSPAATQGFYYIEKTRNVRCFFDFERPVPLEPLLPGGDAQFLSIVRMAVALFCCYVDALLGTATNNYYDGEWFFYTACTGTKYSAHAHSGMTFACVKELGSIVQRFVCLLHELREAGEPSVQPLFFFDPARKTYRCIIDDKVYTPRPFRLPTCSKDAISRNFLQPVAADESRRHSDGTAPRATLTMAENLAIGFIHPTADLHVLNPVLPTDPCDLRKSLVHSLTALPQWPVASRIDLEKVIRDAVDTCQKTVTGSPNALVLPDDEQLTDEDFFIEGSWQLLHPDELELSYEIGLIRRPVARVVSAATMPLSAVASVSAASVTSGASALRDQCLYALAFLLQMLLSSSGRSGVTPNTMATRLRYAVSTSLATSMACSARSERIRNMAKINFDIEIIDKDNDEQSPGVDVEQAKTKTKTTTPSLKTYLTPYSDLFREYSFSAFYLRSVGYYKTIYEKRNWEKKRLIRPNVIEHTTMKTITTRRKLRTANVPNLDQNIEESIEESAALAAFLKTGSVATVAISTKEENLEDGNSGNNTKIQEEKSDMKKICQLNKDEMMTLYARFEQLAPRLLSIPECLLSASQLPRLSERDPLKLELAVATSPLRAGIGASYVDGRTSLTNSKSSSSSSSTPQYTVPLSRSSSATSSPGPQIVVPILAITPDLVSAFSAVSIFSSESEEQTYFYHKR